MRFIKSDTPKSERCLWNITMQGLTFNCQLMKHAGKNHEHVWFKWHESDLGAFPNVTKTGKPKT